MSYKHEDGCFESADGKVKMYYQAWFPQKKPSKTRHLVIHHGFGEHSGRYMNLVEAFQDTDINIYALDARGHGKSQGKKGHIDSLQQFSDDLGAFFQFLQGKYSVKDPVLFGHSMGGVISLFYCLSTQHQQQLTALMTSAAALKPHISAINRVKLFMARGLRVIAPSFTMPAGLDLKFISHDTEVIEAYKRDPLVHGMISSTLALELIEGGEKIINNAAALKLRLFMAHGEDDGIAPYTGTTEAYHNAGSKEKVLKIYPGLYHEIINETAPAKDKVLEDIREFALSAFKSAKL